MRVTEVSQCRGHDPERETQVTAGDFAPDDRSRLARTKPVFVLHGHTTTIAGLVTTLHGTEGRASVSDAGTEGRASVSDAGTKTRAYLVYCCVLGVLFVRRRSVVRLEEPKGRGPFHGFVLDAFFRQEALRVVRQGPRQLVWNAGREVI